MEHTPKEEEIVKQWKTFVQSLPQRVNETPENVVADWWLKIRREAIAERDEEIKKMVERIDDSGGGSGRRLKLQILDYLTQE